MGWTFAPVPVKLRGGKGRCDTVAVVLALRT
jgi:hypothetical protein